MKQKTTKREIILKGSIVTIAMILAMIMPVQATDAIQTVGNCIDNENITYTTSFVMNGNTQTITDTKQCMAGCRENATDYGDECFLKTESTESPILFGMWLFVWGFLLWFEKWYKKTWRSTGYYKLVPMFAFFLNAWIGLLISSSPIMLLPIFLTFFMLTWTAKNELEKMVKRSQT